MIRYDSGNTSERNCSFCNDTDDLFIHPYSEELLIQIHSIIFPALLMAAIIGTVFVLLVLIRKRQYTKMLTTTNIAICALLVSDILLMLTEIFNHIITWGNLHGLGSRMIYFAWETLRIVPGYIQCVVTIERLLAVSKPMLLKQLITRRRMILILGAVITLAASLQISFTACTIYNPNYCTIMALFYQMSIVYCGIPFIFLLVCSTLIIIMLVKRKKSCVRREAQLDANSIRLAVCLVIIDVVFLMTTLPYTILWIFLIVTIDQKPKTFLFEMASLVLVHFGAMTDWIVLLCLGRQVRHASKKLLRCKTERDPRSSFYLSH